MAVLTRITDFVPNTLIKSQEVDDELNQLVNLLSGVSTTKDALIKFNHASDPVLRLDQLGAGLIQSWLNNGVERATMSALGKLLLPAGVGATPSVDRISNFGTYFVDATVRATVADTTETTFSSKSVSANTLGADGDFFLIASGVSFANNANTKRYRIKVGSTVIFDTLATVFTNVNLFVFGYVYRRTSAILTGMFGGIVSGGASIVNLTDAGSFNFAVDGNTLNSTGLNGTANANDIQQFGFFVVKGSV